MAVSKRRLFLRAAFAFLLLIFIPYFLLVAVATTKEFRDAAEDRVGQFLKTDIHIGRIRVGLFNQIILSDFKIKPGSKGRLPGVEVKQIIFRYTWGQLLARNFKIPAAIILKSPKLLMNQDQFPVAFFQEANLKAGSGKISDFELAGGEIRYEIPVIRTPVYLKDIHAAFSPIEGGKIKGVFSAHLQGVIDGQFRISGELNPFTGERHLKGEVSAAVVNRGLLPPDNTLNIRFQIDNNNIILETMNLNLPEQKLKLSGDMQDFTKLPVLNLYLQRTLGPKKEYSELHADFSKEAVAGNWDGEQGKMEFTGKAVLDGKRMLFQELTAAPDYHGSAFLDFGKGEGAIDFQHLQKRLALQAHVRDSEIDLDLKVDHVVFNGIDLVTAARAHLMADPFTPGKPLRLDGNFETDYFILDTITLQDFKGDFELSSQGFSNFNGAWGKYFKTSGNLKFGEHGPEADLTVRVNDLDMHGMKKFATKPLPKDLGGILSGKMKIKGPLAQPRFIGRFTVKDGWLGRVDFEKAIIQFDGLAPSFKLIDSRVYRGRGTLLITGNVDLQADNIVHGVKFETMDHIVLYRGLDVSLTTDKDGVDMEIHPGIKNLPTIGVKSTGGANNDKDERTKDRYLEVGPRFKF